MLLASSIPVDVLETILDNLELELELSNCKFVLLPGIVKVE